MNMGKEMRFDDDLIHVHRDERGAYVVDKTRGMPAAAVFAETLPAAYELSLEAVWNHGAKKATHYDRPGDPPSKEATVQIKVANPFAEPRISRCFPGGPEDLEIYRQEVVNGVHDHWIDPLAKKWTYTYHERLFNYNPSTNLMTADRSLLLPKGVDQVQLIIDDLARDITSKGAQAVTWMPTADPGLESNRPCLQRIWVNVLEDLVNMNVSFRSRDNFKAWFMNAYAISDLQRSITERLSERLQRPFKVGSYIDSSDSLHIYGAYFKEFEEVLAGPMAKRTFENRVWSSDFPAVQAGIEEARANLALDPDFQKKQQ